jgi:hypothetical protein
VFILIMVAEYGLVPHVASGLAHAATFAPIATLTPSGVGEATVRREGNEKEREESGREARVGEERMGEWRDRNTMRREEKEEKEKGSTT